MQDPILSQLLVNQETIALSFDWQIWPSVSAWHLGFTCNCNSILYTADVIIIVIFFWFEYLNIQDNSVLYQCMLLLRKEMPYNTDFFFLEMNKWELNLRFIYAYDKKERTKKEIKCFCSSSSSLCPYFFKIYKTVPESPQYRICVRADLNDLANQKTFYLQD